MLFSAEMDKGELLVELQKVQMQLEDAKRRAKKEGVRETVLHVKQYVCNYRIGSLYVDFRVRMRGLRQI